MTRRFEAAEGMRPRKKMEMSSQFVYLLDADPELAETLDEASCRAAHRYAVARSVEVPPGPWFPQRDFTVDDHLLGLLVLDGVLTRDVRVRTRVATELLGAGDILRPWQPGEQGEPGVCVAWRAHERLRLAVLERRLLRVAAHWPALGEAILHRMCRRARALTFALALNQQIGVDRRVLMLLADAARRWGRVTPAGVRVRLPLTQQTIGQIVGASRPSVSLALGALAARQEAQRDGDEWLLSPEAAELTPAATDDHRDAPLPEAV
jgi:CRP/FNR family transcriptional regulator, cyclic AMP receptor protein